MGVAAEAARTSESEVGDKSVAPTGELADRNVGSTAEAARILGMAPPWRARAMREASDADLEVCGTRAAASFVAQASTPAISNADLEVCGTRAAVRTGWDGERALAARVQARRASWRMPSGRK